MIKVGIVGGTGYVGQELVRLLEHHKEVEIVKIYSESNDGREYASIYRNHTGLTHKICTKLDNTTMAEGVDVLFTALPYGKLMDHMSQQLLDSVRVIDLGVDYRFMNPDEYLKYYGAVHKNPELQKQFTYGLSEWNREEIRRARHIANPGCFATAMELALLPLIQENLLEPSMIVDGKTSYSASGRTLTLGTHYVEANESVKPYKIGKHPHELECTQAISYFTDSKVNLCFVPHVIPMQRGLLVSCYTKAKREVDQKEIRVVYEKYYTKEPFVQLLAPGMYVETKWVRHSNQCHINFELGEDGRQLFLFSAIDNLMKGAASQAVQNFNLMFGLDEREGIDFLPDCI